MIEVLWQNVVDLWVDRNADRHGVDEAVNRSQLRNHVLLELKVLYEKKMKVLSRDRVIFRADYETHALDSTHNIRNWIALHTNTIRTSAKEARKKNLLGVPTLWAWLRS